MDTANLSIVISHPMNSTGERRVSMRIEDEASRMTLANISLTPEQFTDLLSSRHIHVEAEIPSRRYRSRLFQRREHTIHHIPKDVGAKYDYGRDEAVAAAVDAWAEKIRVDEGWDVAAVQTRSQDFYAIFERWIEQ